MSYKENMLCFSQEKQNDILKQIDQDNFSFIANYHKNGPITNLFHVRLYALDEKLMQTEIPCPDGPTGIMYLIAQQKELMINGLLKNPNIDDNIDFLYSVDGFNILHIAAQGKPSIFQTVLKLFRDLNETIYFSMPNEIVSNTYSVFQIIFAQRKYSNLILLLENIKPKTQLENIKHDLLLSALQINQDDLIIQIIYAFGNFSVDEVSEDILNKVKDNTGKQYLKKIAFEKENVKQEQTKSKTADSDSSTKPNDQNKYKTKEIKRNKQVNKCHFMEEDNKECGVIYTTHLCNLCGQYYCDLHYEIHMNSHISTK